MRRTSHIQKMDVLLRRFTWVEEAGIRLYRCYLPSSDSIEEFERSLDARKCWQDLCEKVDSDPWGRPYTTVMNKIKPRGTSAPSRPPFLDRVV